MAAPYADEEVEKPLDPAVERVRRKLVRFVAINLGLLFVALMAVLAAIVYKTGGGRETAAGEPFAATPADRALLTGDIVLPPGTRILSHSLSGNRLSFDTENAGGRAILIYDLAERRLVGRFAVILE